MKRHPSPGRFSNARQDGFTLIEVTVVVVVVGILAAIFTPIAACSFQRARMARVLKDMEVCQSTVEVFEAEFGRFPGSLEEAFGDRGPPTTITYCFDEPDANAGHGNETCSFFDADNPSGQNQQGGIPGLGYILTTYEGLAPCLDIKGAWSTCCGGEPNLVRMDEDFDLGHPGNPGGPGGY